MTKVMLPTVGSGSFPTDGTVLKIHDRCKSADRKQCHRHYDTVRKGARGFHTCPYKLTTYKTGSGKIISSLDLNANESFHELVHYQEYVFDTEEKSLREKNSAHHMINSLLHELRKANRDIKSCSEKIIMGLERSEQPISLPVVIDYAKKIFGTSSLVSARYTYFDFEINSSSMINLEKSPVGAYRKFDKSRKCLEFLAREKQINVRMSGRSVAMFEASQTFEVLPYILIDNAIKYSPKDQEVEIKFYESMRNIEVFITSIGPMLEDGEEKLIFNDGYRGINAKRMAHIEGQGFGLALAKKICDMHSIEISAFSKPSAIQISSVKYETFTIYLKIPLGKYK